jgi:hypothetical protein
MVETPDDFDKPECVLRILREGVNGLSVVYKKFIVTDEDIESGFVKETTKNASEVEPGDSLHPILDYERGEAINACNIPNKEALELLLSPAALSWGELQQAEKFSVSLDANYLCMYRYEEYDKVDPNLLPKDDDRENYRLACDEYNITAKEVDDDRPFAVKRFQPASYAEARLRHGPLIDGLYGKPGDLVFEAYREEGDMEDRKPWWIVEWQPDNGEVFACVNATGDIMLVDAESLTRNWRGKDDADAYNEDWETGEEEDDE